METQVELLWEKKIGGVKKVHIIDNNHVAVVSDKCFYMFDLNGELKWKHEVDRVNKVVMCASFFGEYIALSLGGEICLFDIEGNLKWRYETGSEMLYLSDKYVVSGYTDEECSHISLFDIKGDLLWNQKIHNPIYYVYLYKESIIACTGFVEENKNFYIFNKDGKLGWSGLSPDKESERYTGFSKYVLCYEWYLYLIEIDKKEEAPRIRWEYTGRGDIGSINSVYMSNDYIAFGGTELSSGENGVFLLDINGNLKWKKSNEDEDEGNIYEICIENEYVLAGSYNGFVYLFDINGNLKWKHHMAVVRSVMGEKWLKEKLEKEGITISTNKISIDNEREMIIDKDIVRRPQEYYPVKSISMKNKHLIIGSGEGIHTFRINNQNKIKTDVLQ